MKLPSLVGYTNPELRAIINLARDQYRANQSVEAAQAKAKFHVGQRVGWSSKRGYAIEGTIIAINIKNVKVQTENEGTWNVYPGFLYPVEGVAKAPDKKPVFQYMTAGQKAAATRRLNALNAQQKKFVGLTGKL